MRLESRVALITGAGQGIGVACARRFAQQGASVMLVDVDVAQRSALAIALAPHRIGVNAIGPGAILTEMAKAAVLTNDEARRKILSRSPLGRCGEPEEIAAVAALLASDAAFTWPGKRSTRMGGGWH